MFSMSSCSPTAWADDPELSASLSMLLSELDGSRVVTNNSPSSPSSSSESTSNDFAMRRPPGKKALSRNASRERVQKELVALRRLATELERELDAIKLTELTSTPVIGAGTESDAVQVYKAMAKRQHQARRRAELTNRKLHDMLAQQNEVVQELCRVVSRCRRAQETLSLWSSADITSVLQRSHPSRQDLLKRTVDIGEYWNEPFREYHGSTVSDTKIIRDNGREIIIEVHSSSTHPFAYHDMSTQLWSFWKHGNVLEENYTVSTETRLTPNMIGFTFQAASARDGVVHEIVGDGVRHAIPHVTRGSVFTSSSYAVYYMPNAEQTEDKVALFRDLWVHVAPSDVASVTNVRYVARGYLSLTDLQDHQRPHVDELTNQLRWFIQKELCCAMDAAETALLRPPNRRLDIAV